MNRILIIDDDPMITKPLSQALRQRGYDVLIAANGRNGLDKALAISPDLVLLDVMMPLMDGWEVCRELRKQSGVPIVMLTALGDEIDRILGLELGADDYITKPFSTRELLARIRAMLRRVEIDRATTTVSNELAVANIRVNLDTREAWRDGRPLSLRYKEFELLSLLMSRAGHPVNRSEIFDAVWGIDWIGDTRTLDVHIRWLREKIEETPSKPRLIQTVRSVGYRFAEGS